MSDDPRATELFALQVEATGPAWKGTADAIRAGFRNVWVAAGIAAIAALLALVPEEDE